MAKRFLYFGVGIIAGAFCGLIIIISELTTQIYDMNEKLNFIITHVSSRHSYSKEG